MLQVQIALEAWGVAVPHGDEAAEPAERGAVVLVIFEHLV